MGNSQLFGEWLQTWHKVYAPIRCSSGVTLERYQRLLNYVLNGATPQLATLAATELHAVTHQQLESAILSLMPVRTQRKAHLGIRSIRHIAGVLRVALQKAYTLELIERNPMVRVELPAPEPGQARALTLDEVKRLRRVCRGDWTGLLVELALATGCRRGELLALEWKDIDWRKRVLAITKSVEETKAGLRLKCPKSKHFRYCTLPKSTLEMLRRAKTRHPLIFATSNGRWRSPALVSQTIVRRMQKAGIERASIHSLRHTHATVLLSRGLPVPAVAARLGHADSHITLRIYGHAMPLDDHRLADEWDCVLKRLRA